MNTFMCLCILGFQVSAFMMYVMFSCVLSLSHTYVVWYLIVSIPDFCLPPLILPIHKRSLF